MKRLFQKTPILPAERPLHFIEIERGPGMHRGIHVAEVPLVGGNLPVRMGVEIAQHQQQLFLGEIEIHQGQGDRVEGQVPGRIPRILPLVGHGDHIGVQHVKPFRVAHAVPGRFEQRMTLVLLKPSGPDRSSRTACSRACRPAPDGARAVRRRSTTPA